MRDVRRAVAAALLAAGCAVVSCSVPPTGRREQVATRAEPAPSPAAAPAAKIQNFTATAYAIKGTTASGHRTRKGFVAADPDILPLGSRIRVSGAGKYSGVYLVKDTGRKINGHEIDIFLEDNAEAKRFGKKRVQVEVLSRGGSKSGTAARADGR